MKIVLLLLLLHIIVCTVVGWLSLETKQTADLPSPQTLIERAREAEKSGTLTTQGFSLGTSTTAYSIHGAVLIYAVAGLLGLVAAACFALRDLVAGG